MFDSDGAGGYVSVTKDMDHPSAACVVLDVVIRKISRGVVVPLPEGHDYLSLCRVGWDLHMPEKRVPVSSRVGEALAQLAQMLKETYGTTLTSGQMEAVDTVIRVVRNS